jgi:outer membrane receptor protein involved in Fe transport
MGLGHSHMETGDFEFLFDYPRQDGYKRTTRAFAKLDRQITVSHLGGLLNVASSGNLDNEQTRALELGYHGKLTTWTTLQLNTYWQKYHDLIGYVQTTPSDNQVQNAGGARAYGAEAELTFHHHSAKLLLWYGYHKFTPTGESVGLDPSQNVRALLPAKHKAGATLRYAFPGQFTANLNTKYSSKTESGHGPWGADPSAFYRVDMTLTKAFHSQSMQGELLMGVSDLFNETNFIARDTLTIRYQHHTPGRTYFLRLLGRF